MKKICELHQIKKEFCTGERIALLNGIDLTVVAGDFISIEGGSGIGKSTLLYVLGTLMRFDGGEYLFEGKDVSKLTDAQISELRAEKVGFLFQNTNLIQALTIRENMIFASRIGKRSDYSVDELLERFGLTDHANHLPHQLSGGQKRRAGAVRSMLHKPSLLLADEPTNDLDQHWSHVMLDMLKSESQRGAGVVLVTHNESVSEHAVKRYALEDGRLIEK